MSNSHSQSQQGTPSASTSTAATAQLATDEGARELITGYPLAAGFTSVADGQSGELTDASSPSRVGLELTS